jgi:hypothetical protein
MAWLYFIDVCTRYPVIGVITWEKTNIVNVNFIKIIKITDIIKIIKYRCKTVIGKLTKRE